MHLMNVPLHYYLLLHALHLVAWIQLKQLMNGQPMQSIHNRYDVISFEWTFLSSVKITLVNTIILILSQCCTCIAAMT